MDRVVVVKDRHMAADAELGTQLTGSFFRKLCLEESKPEAIVFYGSGVQLLADGSPVLDALDVLSRSGVDLIGCGTCAGYYQLKDAVKVGRLSDMVEIISTLMKAASVVTI